MNSDEVGMATRTGVEPVVSAVTGRRVDRYTSGPLNPKGLEPPVASGLKNSGTEKADLFLFDQAADEISVFPSPEIQNAPFLSEHPLYGAAVRSALARLAQR